MTATTQSIDDGPLVELQSEGDRKHFNVVTPRGRLTMRRYPARKSSDWVVLLAGQAVYSDSAGACIGYFNGFVAAHEESP
jgi:hypothetical protein